MTRISVYLSSYNHAPYLRQAIDGVLHQTFTDFELFIEDDASSDASWSIIQSYTDPRIRAFRNPVNRNNKQGMRRVIYEMSGGEYIAIQHSDNIWEPAKLQQQVDFLDAHPETGAVFTNAEIIAGDGRPMANRLHPYYRLFDQPNRSRHAWLNYFFYRGNALCHPSVLIRRQVHDDCGFYRSGLSQLPDLDMWIRLCLKYEIHVIPEKLIRFRVRDREMNKGGERPETRVRARFEQLQILDSYLQIPTFDELVKVFPSAAKYLRPDGFDIGYVLGMVALETRGDNPIFDVFGLQLLFQAINDAGRAHEIERLYGFTHMDLISLTAAYDVFPIEATFALFLSRTILRLFPQDSVRFRSLRELYKAAVSPKGMIKPHRR